MNIVYIKSYTNQEDYHKITNLVDKCNIHKCFYDEGKDKSQLEHVINFATKGDTIYICDFCTLATNTKRLLKVINRLEQKKVNLVVVNESLDTRTPEGKLMIETIKKVNNFETQCLLEKQHEGIKKAQIKGLYKGRKPIDRPECWEAVYDKWKCREVTGVQAMKELNLKKSTFYRMINEYEDTKKI